MSSINRFLGSREAARRLGPEAESFFEELLGGVRDLFGISQSVTAAPRELSATPPELLRRQPGRFESGFTTG
jgi:hypothetical protein